MIENNLTHFIGSDAHNTEIRPFLMKDLFNDKKLRDYYEDMNGFISNAKLVVDDKKFLNECHNKIINRKDGLGYKQQMRGFMAHLSVKLRLLILALIDSLIVTFSVFVSYYILEPYFKTYSVKLLILAAISLFISHHISAFIFNMYHRAWEYASVSELILIVKAVTTSIVITMVVVTIVTGNRPFLDCI